MGFLVLFGGLFVYCIGTIFQTYPKNKHAFTPDELEQLSKAMCGKSKTECRRILNSYREI